MEGRAWAPNRTKEEVRRLRDLGLGQREIALKLGLAKSTVAYHFRTLGQQPDERFARRYDWAVIQAAYDTGLSVRECAKRFGFNKASWFKAVRRGDIIPRPQELPLEELLVAARSEGERT